MQRIVTILTLLTALAAAGCGSAATIPKWQQQVEQYIDREGGGNFAALRDLGSDDAVRRIGLFGSKQGVVAPKRTDVNSVLVAHRRVGDDNWLLFVVARVRYDGGVVDVQFDQPHVIDLRAAAVRRDGDDYHWIVSDEDASQVEAYLAAQRADWQKSHPDRADRVPDFTIFPTPADRFRLVIDGDRAVITEARSGATWALDLADTDRRIAESEQ